MARLQEFQYNFYELTLGSDGRLVYGSSANQPIPKLPQIFWKNGSSWSEANLYCLEMAAPGNVKIETVHRKMKHIQYFASYVEKEKKDWRHFPRRREDQILKIFRGHLIDQRETGILSPGTVTNCMNVVVDFYRFVQEKGFINPQNKMWRDREIAMPIYDNAGFLRIFVTRTTDLSIPNKQRVGGTLEDGLLPLSADHMTRLLQYTAANATSELHLLLSTGFFSGARIGTITTLTVNSLLTASIDPYTEGILRLPAGPGTGIATKFSVSGSLWIPEALMKELIDYASSTRRLLRERFAKPEHKNVLFLTRSGQPYSVKTVVRLISGLRDVCCEAGLRFMRKFTFHQTRATFGTWLTRELMTSGLDTATVLSEVKSAMFHKYESTTWRYIRFLETTKAKIEAASKFNELFTGIRGRDWGQTSA
ncbi:site-specific integrase [Herbaspirillum seropedicae]|uniref:Bacteriophage integrase/recombinase protein n=1 Tax=Herbaspirillum seropedicae (strain SmR1) TaxID=757424 RepID=D8ITE2_HERSS|nr:site-specific integrase [Herbaspirillum seropedicae]ADJ65572.1 bacteriophage integrase/recombinase protein [Herbaspirillum seropedicae SmR1]AKN67397.1 integrase [Herbaspirillum seropedicae]NQE31989.1 integrase [Herbaspirillum seropedicae]UMU23405.1 site-specific integrase [Herbaspirillum seropedicae]